MMARLAGLDEIIKADVERAPDTLELDGHGIAIGLRILIQLRRSLGHLDRVLIIAHEKQHFQAGHPAITGLHVGTQLLESCADVWPAVRVVDCRSLEEAGCFAHDSRVPSL